MQGRIDTSFQTLQRDLFASGLAAKIGTNAFVVWLAIKSHADFNTGQAWPGLRRLAVLTGLAVGSVSKGVRVLIEARLLRLDVVSRGKGRKGSTYTARERLDVRLGERVLCTIVLDYVPATMRTRLKDIDRALRTGTGGAEVLAQCEIIPGDGFVWHADTGSLHAAIPASEVPTSTAELGEDLLKAPVVQRVLAAQLRAPKR